MALLATACVGGAFVRPAAATAPPPAASPSPSPTALATPGLAPADEYFGLSRMSVLEIANRLRDLAREYDWQQRDAAATLGAASLTVDALRDWEHRYPTDRWLPRSLFALERLYARLPTAEARNRLWQTDHWLEHDYPASPEAAFCRREIAAHHVLAPPRRGEVYAVADPHQSLPSQVAVRQRPSETAAPVVPRAWRALAQKPAPKPPNPAPIAEPKAATAPVPNPTPHISKPPRAAPKPPAPVSEKPSRPTPAPAPKAATKAVQRPVPRPSSAPPAAKPHSTANPQAHGRATPEPTPPGGDVPRF